MTTHGYKTTIPVTMDEMVNHCEAVSRGANDAFLIGDMPYMSYQASNELAVENAGRFIVAGMDCVKVEGAMVDRVKAIVDSGIMVMSHLGLTPHTRAKLGGYRVQGKTAKSAEIVFDQALRLQDAGCSSSIIRSNANRTSWYDSRRNLIYQFMVLELVIGLMVNLLLYMI